MLEFCVRLHWPRNKMGRELPLLGTNWGLTDGWPAGRRGTTLSQEQGESHTFRGYCFLHNHLPHHGKPVLSKLRSLYKHCWYFDLQRFQKLTIVVSLEGLGAYSGPPLQRTSTFQFVHFFFFYIGYWWLLWKRRSFWNAAECQISLGTFKTENRWNQNGGAHEQLSLQSM